MKDKLLSILKQRKSKGFTLIELLIVIAIIAVLVLIVVVAINPAQRLRDADNQQAASNVRSAGTLISTCVTLANGDLTQCNSAANVASVGEGNWPANVTYASAAGEICAIQEGGDQWYIYRFTTGEVAEVAASPTC